MYPLEIDRRAKKQKFQCKTSNSNPTDTTQRNARNKKQNGHWSDWCMIGEASQRRDRSRRAH